MHSQHIQVSYNRTRDKFIQMATIMLAYKVQETTLSFQRFPI